MSAIDKRVVNLDQLKLEHFEKGDKFACDTVRIGPLVGAKALGYSYDVVPPGKIACPFHSHRGEEEMLLHRARHGDAALRRSHAKDSRRRPDLLPDRRARHRTPGRERFRRGACLLVDQHDDAGRSVRIPRLGQDRGIRRRHAACGT